MSGVYIPNIQIPKDNKRLVLFIDKDGEVAVYGGDDGGDEFVRITDAIEVPTHGDWHTGTPTAEGWYLLALTTKVFNDNPFCVAYMDGHHWLGIDDFCIFVDHVLAWQKIEPFEASK